MRIQSLSTHPRPYRKSDEVVASENCIATETPENDGVLF